MNRPFNLLIGLLLYASSCWAQPYRTQALTVADGLSQGYVSSLFQDSRGFIWIGTFNGLNRYDGRQIKRFVPNNSVEWSLKATFIHSITEDTAGLLWIGTEKGPVVLDPYTERFVHLDDFVPELSDREAVHIIPGAYGRVWISHRQPQTTGLITLRPPNNLTQLIREEKLAVGDFEAQQVRLLGSMFSPIGWISLLQDSTLVATDVHRLFWQIDPTTLTAKRADPRTLNYKRHGQYGLLYTDASNGFVFLPNHTPGNQPDNRDYWAPFVQHDDGQITLIWPGSRKLTLLDTVRAHRQLPGPRATFHDQFATFLELDKAPSRAAMLDHAGNLWIGTTGYGVRKIGHSRLDFTRYKPDKSFTAFRFLPDGRLWPGIHHPHHVFNPDNGAWEPAPWAASPDDGPNPYNLIVARNGAWWVVSSVKSHALALLKKENATAPWTNIPIQLTYLNSVPIQMLEDQRGAIWLAGNQAQLYRVHPQTNAVSQWDLSPHFPEKLIARMRSSCMRADRFGNLWIGTNAGLIQVQNPEGEPVFRVWHNYSGQKPIFASDWIMCVYPEPDIPQVVWLGLNGGGLLRFDTRTQQRDYYTEKDGLTNNVVYSILPDSFGYLWLSTTRGLSRFYPKNRTFTDYSSNTPEISIEFNSGSCAYAPDGSLAFGSTEGLFLIRPKREPPNRQPLNAVVTRIEINGQALDFPWAEKCLLLRPDNSFHLRLPFARNDLLIEFAAPHANAPATVQYRYRFLPLNEYWTNTGLQRTANLVNLPAGAYTLEVQAKASDDQWANAPIMHLHVTILPPWHQSIWALMLYSLAILFLVLRYFQFVRKRLALEHDMAMNRKEIEQIKTLDDFKNRFFAYISHEFKTPLTIIIGLAERLRNGHQSIANADNIARQGQAMLELVDQMVDIARLDEQTLHLSQVQGNFSQHIRYLVESHRPLADFGKVRLDIHTSSPDVIMDFDPMRLRYIISNLISNAIQHTNPDGAVQVTVQQTGPDQVRLEVSDTGMGIAPEHIAHIFDRYFQIHQDVNQNTTRHFGLGLAFVKDLVELFRGSITVDSQLGIGTSFVITLPITQTAQPMPEQPKTSSTDVLGTVVFAPSPGLPNNRPLLLIVEDNPVITDYLQTCLQQHFEFLIAANGQAGWEIALERIPDLILSDVMMPRMDGLELTQKIKMHPLTSHIPMVLLSARTTMDDRLLGQQQGADAYLGKPFNERELLLTLQNLHTQQRRWQERYAVLQRTPVRVTPAPQNTASAAIQNTDAFLMNMYNVFAKNYTNERYDLVQLSHDLEVSKSQLQRKLAALSDQSAMELLRQYRMNQARILLENNPDINIREVCFLVGLKDPAYFSRMFLKTFGISPSEARGKDS